MAETSTTPHRPDRSTNRSQIFVGRKDELAQWDRVLADPNGQAILVVGQRGMGKTTLVNKLADLARCHPRYKCAAVRYEVTPTDAVNDVMTFMLDHAFDAAQITPGSFDATQQRLDQWRAFLNVLGVGDLLMSLRRDPARSVRDQFVERLRLISGRIPENARALFIIDPEKYVAPDSDQAWAIVVRQLPPNIKFLFAQRPDDVLARSPHFRRLTSRGLVTKHPQGELDRLDEEAADDLIQQRAVEMNHDPRPLLAALKRYDGHPYALDAALGLVAAGKRLDELPADPTPEEIAKEQWRMIAAGGANHQHGDKAVRLFLAHAVLEVPVPDEVAYAVAEIDHPTRAALLADPYLSTLLRHEGERKRIYHAILSDHMLESTKPNDRAPYHRRTIDFYRERLRQARESQSAPDALAAERLSEHVLTLEGLGAFIQSFVDECTRPLVTLGLFDIAQSLSQRALQFVADDSMECAVVCGNLGTVLATRGDLDGAEQMHRKALAIEEKLGRLEGLASDYVNLGIVLRTRGDLDGAEAMYRKALAINEKLGRLEGMANAYGNLGNVLRIRGDLAGAEAMYRKVLEIDEKLGRLESIANAYDNLGIVLQTRGDLDGAETMYRKALAINEQLGRLEGMASAYGNLGLLYEQRGDKAAARELWTKARDLYVRIGMPHMVTETQALLDQLDAPP